MAVELQSVPCAPGRLPFLGHARPLGQYPLSFLKSLRDTGDVVRVDLGTLPVYFVTTAELIHELLVTKARSFDKGRFFKRMRILVGDGLLTAGEEVHRRNRRLMQPMFHQARIAGYAEIMGNRAHAMAESWTAGETVAVDEQMYEFAISVLAETMFSADIGRPAAEAVRQDFPILAKNALIRALSPALLDRLPIPANRQFDMAAARLRRVIDDVIVAERSSAGASRADLLSTLLAARDADTGEALSDEEIRDELVTILFAGAETAAITLSWAFYEIARHPEIEQQLAEEVDAVVGTRPVGLQDIAKLEYTGRVAKELLRLHSGTLLMRSVIAPVELGGVNLPVGTEIGFSPYALHRDPHLYPDPERFDPDRWLSENHKNMSRWEFIPFGSGNRKCIGDAFAQTEIVIALATVISRWRLRPLPDHTVREVAAAMPRPDRLPMTPVPRGS